MKRWTLLTVASALACAGSLWAADPPAGANLRVMNAGEGQPVNGVWGGQNEAKFYIQNLEKAVRLTEDQKKNMTDIIAARQKAMQDFSTENAEKIKAAGKVMTDAFKSQDHEAIAKAQEDYQVLYGPLNKIMKKSYEDLNKVLTAEQTTALQDYRAMEAIKGMTAPAKLTDGQIKQLKAAIRDAAHDPESRESVLPQAIDQVLTPDQKATIGKSRAMSYAKMMFARAKLTPDQMKQVDIICDEAGKDYSLNDGGMYKALSEKINELLTDDQKNAMSTSPWNQAGGVIRSDAPGAVGAPLNPAK